MPRLAGASSVLSMAGAITDEQWQASREGLREAAERFAGLIRSTDSSARVTKDWSVGDMAAHVTAIALAYTTLAQPGEAAYRYPWSEIDISVINVDSVHALNEQVLELYTERDSRQLADQLCSHVDTMLSVSAGLDPDKPVSWLGGSSVPLAGLFAHLTNELNVHGWDITKGTKGTKGRWVTPPGEAVLFLDVFVRGSARKGMGKLMGSNAPPPRRRIAVEFLSRRHMQPLTLVLSGGANGEGSMVTVGEPGAPVDVRIRFEPVTLNLMLFGRISQVRAGLSGKVFVSGPRPWLLPAFQRVVHFPS